MDCKQTHTQTKEIEETEDYGTKCIDNEMQRLWYYHGNSDQRTMEITKVQQMQQL